MSADRRDCCAVDPTGLAERFDEGMAREDLEDYRDHGVDKVTGRLLELLKERGVAGRTLTDVGGGVGIVSHELLAAGLADAIEIDASRPYLEAALDESRRRGTADRFHTVEGDFVVVRTLLEPTHIVTLDRALCCYPDAGALASAAAAQARETLALLYPADRWWVRCLDASERAVAWLRRRRHAFWVHRDVDVDAAVRTGGLELVRRERWRYWQIALYQRPSVTS